jgi:hypothetical protein
MSRSEARTSGRPQGRWVRIDRRYNNPYRLTPYAWRVILKWGTLIVVWLILGSLYDWVGLIGLIVLIGYAIHRIRLDRVQEQIAARAPVPMAARTLSSNPMHFNPPPGWPPAPAGWTPPSGWQPDPSWPSIPAGWPLWMQDSTAPAGERNTRVIAQDVKIAVAVRDQGRCRQCGSNQDLHYDHVIPWSKCGANTVNNIQLLCGPCNRTKGADDIPF